MTVSPIEKGPVVGLAVSPKSRRHCVVISRSPEAVWVYWSHGCIVLHLRCYRYTARYQQNHDSPNAKRLDRKPLHDCTLSLAVMRTDLGSSGKTRLPRATSHLRHCRCQFITSACGKSIDFSEETLKILLEDDLRFPLLARIPQHTHGQVAVSEQMARRLRQRCQQAELGRGQRQRPAVERGPALCSVNGQSDVVQDVMGCNTRNKASALRVASHKAIT